MFNQFDKLLTIPSLELHKNQFKNMSWANGKRRHEESESTAKTFVNDVIKHTTVIASQSSMLDSAFENAVTDIVREHVYDQEMPDEAYSMEQLVALFNRRAKS